MSPTSSKAARSGKRRIETAFGVTSLTPETATPERLLTLNRGHWTIEAAHHILDWSFDEIAAASAPGTVRRT